MKQLQISLLVFGILFLQPMDLEAQNGQQMFQKGMIQEQGEGNLSEAIAIYDAMVNDVDVNRTLRAKALLQIGICYEKLGNQKAIRAYQKLITEYADQTNIVALGKKKLKGLIQRNTDNEGIVATKIRFAQGDGGVISPDGRFLMHVDWSNENGQPAINIKDLETKKSRIVSKPGVWDRPIKFPNSPVWSPDGKQFAYSWYDANLEGCEFHIANANGSNDRIIKKGTDALRTFDWSPDGKFIVGVVNGKIVSYSINEQRFKTLKANDSLEIFSMNISPDSKYIAYEIQRIKGAKGNDIHVLDLDGGLDTKIIAKVSHDFNPKWSPDGKGLVFISDRRGTNDLWEIGIEKGRRVGQLKMIKSNLGERGSLTTILGITKDQSLYYETMSSRSDIYVLNGDKTGQPILNSAKRISKLIVKENTNPVISPDQRYVAFVKWQLFKDEGITGRPFSLLIYDREKDELKETALRLYTLAQLYFYYPKPKWSPDGTKIMIQGRKKLNEDLQAGVFIYDLETETSQAVLEMTDYKKFSEDPSTGTDHSFSIDGKSIYYLKSDRKHILKLDIESLKETLVYTSTMTISDFKMSHDASKIALNYSENYLEAYIVDLTEEVSKTIVVADDSNAILLIGWNSENTHFYFRVGDSQSASIKRVSVVDGKAELVYKMENNFAEGEIREFDMNLHSGSTAIQLGVQNIEMWKLEGLFKD